MKNDRKTEKSQFSTNSYNTQKRITEKEGQIAKKKKNKYFTDVDTGLRSLAKVPQV